MAKKTLTLQEAYTLLEVTKGANIEEVKQAYRKRAFALHPDLHPDNANAAAEFQRVNEAYVTVIAYLDNEAKKQSAKAQFVNAEKERKRKFEEQKRQAEQKRAEERQRKEKERAERIERERKEMERRQAKERAKREEERRRRIQEEIDKEEARIKAKQEEERLKLIKKLEEKAQEFKALIIEQMEAVRKENELNAQRQAQKEQSQNQQSWAGQPQQENAQPQFKKVNNTYNASGEAAYNKYAGSYEQSVYHTSANDFADTSAFEKENTSQSASGQSTNNQGAHTQSAQETAFTNYNTVQNEAQNTQKKNPKEHFTGQEISVTKENSIPQAIIKASTEPLEGIKKGISSWFKSQIDEELELFFPAAKLQPGVKMRLQFRVGLANELQTIELTLPKDFVPGKPMRLKGLGKKIGKWQGDLYLKLQSK